MGYVNKHGDIIQLLSPVRYVESPEGGPLFFSERKLLTAGDALLFG